MNERLATFVDRCLERGLSRNEIEAALLNAGWPADEVAEALETYADVDFPIPIPRPKPYLPARDALVCIGLFSALFVAAIAWGHLLFELVNRLLPDGTRLAHQWTYGVARIRWATASLLIAAPLFGVLARRAHLAAIENPVTRGSRIKKWLTSLTLIVAAATAGGDLITLIYYLLSGELTLRFILKVAIVAMLTGGVFAYLLWTQRQDDLDPSDLPTSSRSVRLTTGLFALLIASSLIYGFVVSGSPATARAKALDAERVRHLTDISLAIDRFFENRGALPRTLSDLEDERGIYDLQWTDPGTSEPYDYRVIDEEHYELCATFEQSNEARRRGDRGDRFWTHSAGRACFTAKVQEP